MAPSDMQLFAIPTRFSCDCADNVTSDKKGSMGKVENSTGSFSIKDVTIDTSANNDDDSYDSNGWGHYSHVSGNERAPKSIDFEFRDEGEDSRMHSLAPAFGNSGHTKPSRRHSCPDQTLPDEEQILLEQNHIALKLKHAELLTHFERVENSLKRTSQDNLLLKEQITDATSERDRAMAQVQQAMSQVDQLAAMVTSLRMKTDRLARERNDLRTKLAVAETNFKDGEHRERRELRNHQPQRSNSLILDFMTPGCRRASEGDYDFGLHARGNLRGQYGH